MLLPVHTPIGTGDRITALRSHLIASLSPSRLFTSLAVKRHGSVEALVIVHRDDGAREQVTAGEARGLAQSLREAWSGTDRGLCDLADSLDDAAEAAERQASAILLGQGSGGGVRQARPFGAR